MKGNALKTIQLETSPSSTLSAHLFPTVQVKPENSQTSFAEHLNNPPEASLSFYLSLKAFRCFLQRRMIHH